MLKAAYRALGDLTSTPFRMVLVKSIALTIGLFVIVLVLTELLLVTLTQFSWPWAESIVAVGTGVMLIVAFFFLMSPVAAAFAGLFLDQVAETVERQHYPADPPGTALPLRTTLPLAAKFFIVVFAVNIIALPAALLGFGALALIIANAYLLSREYFEMVAMRHMAGEAARALRKRNAPAVFLAGLLPAALTLIPIVNLVVPLFATSFFTHLFKSVRLSSS